MWPFQHAPKPPIPTWLNGQDTVCCVAQFDDLTLRQLNAWAKGIQSPHQLTVLSLAQLNSSSRKFSTTTPTAGAWPNLINWYTEARPLVDATVDEFLARTPQLLALPLLGSYIREALTHRLQLLLGNDHFSLMAQCASDPLVQANTQAKHHQTFVVLDSVPTATQWQSLFQQWFPAWCDSKNPTINTVYTTHRHHFCQRWQRLNKRVARKPLSKLKQNNQPLLLVTGHPRHQQLLAPLAQGAKQRNLDCAIVNYGASQLSRNDASVIQAGEVKFRKALAKPLLAQLKQLIDHTTDYSRDAWLLDRILTLAESALTMDALCYTIQPGLVAGCFEKTSLGPAICALQQQHGFTLHNVEHGRIFDTQTLDLMPFNHFVVWDDAVANLVQHEGFTGNISIIGNPDEPKTLPVVDASNPIVNELNTWLAGRQLLLATTQSYRGYYTATIKHGYLQALLDYVAKRPNICLLIRTHPAETDTMVSDLIQHHPARSRIRHQRPSEVPYTRVLPLANVVTSVYSTTLLEAAWYGVASLAVDFHGINAFTGMPTANLRIARNLEDTGQQLDTLFAQGPGPLHPQTYNEAGFVASVLDGQCQASESPPVVRNLSCVNN